ncbi:MAG: hypothetical protein M1820_002195 [Bogoriella megaspora]|nr:MAG: hypothetical protein M1820_002195 [Bogoriella megaspora]
MEKKVSPPPLKRRRLSSLEPEKRKRSLSLESREQSDGINLRVFSWNVNGIEPFIQHIVQKPIDAFFKPRSTTASASTDKSSNIAPKADLRAFLRRQAYPTILFLQEVKMAPTDTKAQRAVHTAINPPLSSLGTKRTLPNEDVRFDEPTYTAHFNLPTDPYNATGFGRKVYGVASLIRDDFTGKCVKRVRNVDWDAEGRIQVIETHIPLRYSSTSPSVTDGGSLKLAIFNVYLVNGTSHPYKSSSTGEVIGTRHDRKREVHRLLQKECREMMDEGWEVLIAGDVNVARSELDGWPRLRTSPEEHVVNRADFERRFFEAGKGTHGDVEGKDAGNDVEGGEGLDLVDSFRWMHGRRRGYTYYPRGSEWGSSCDRVDQIMLSKGLLGNSGGSCRLKQADILESSQERGPSDHVPLFVELDFGALHTINQKMLMYLSYLKPNEITSAMPAIPEASKPVISLPQD